MDGVEDVYMFLDDQEGGSDAIPEREELPTGVITMLTRCYSPSCGDGVSCYAYSCPRKVCFRSFELNLIHLIPFKGNYILSPHSVQAETPVVAKESHWAETIDVAVLNSLPESEINRQG
jgi:RHO1 GDP-GTP exchange protein 1/2